MIDHSETEDRHCYYRYCCLEQEHEFQAEEESTTSDNNLLSPNTVAIAKLCECSTLSNNFGLTLLSSALGLL